MNKRDRQVIFDSFIKKANLREKHRELERELELSMAKKKKDLQCNKGFMMNMIHKG